MTRPNDLLISLIPRPPLPSASSDIIFFFSLQAAVSIMLAPPSAIPADLSWKVPRQNKNKNKDAKRMLNTLHHQPAAPLAAAYVPDCRRHASSLRSQIGCCRKCGEAGEAWARPLGLRGLG